MELKRKIDFELEGIGNLTVETGAMSVTTLHLYQNGVKLKKTKSGFKGVNFDVINQEGNTESILIRKKILSPVAVIYKNTDKELERKLTTREKIISCIPILVMILGVFLIGGIGGVIGGAMIGFSVALSLMASEAFIREGKFSAGTLIGVLLGVGLVFYIVYAIISMMFLAIGSLIFS